MRFRVDRDVLADAVAWASRALPARPVIPVLSGLLLRAAEDGLTLSCFDYEVSARVEVDAEIAEPGTVLVPGRLLAEITRSLPGLPVEFADDPDGVSLTCGSAAFTLVTLPVEDYPDLPGLPQTAGTVDGGALAAAIGQVAPASSRDDTLPLLTGVNVEVNGGTMTLAATDRYRLAVRDLPWDPAQPGMSGAYLVPARTLVDAARTMSPGVPVTIKLQSGGGTAQAEGGPGDPGRGRFGGTGDGPGSGGVSSGGVSSGGLSSGGLSSGGAARAGTDAMIGFETDGRRLTTRLIAGEFIKYRSRFPAEFRCRADMPVGPFTEAVKRVSLVAERGTAVRLVFGGGTVTIEAGTQGRARAREVVPAQFDGTEPEIAFSPHFLLDGITASAVSAAASEEGSASVVPGDPVQHEDGPKVAARKADGRKVDGRKTDGRTKAGSGRGSKAGSKRKEPAKRGDSGAARGDRADQGDQDGGRIRLEFSSATKPAVITGIRAGTATTVTTATTATTAAAGAATPATAPVVALASVGAGAGSAEAGGAGASEAAAGDQAAAGAVGGGPAGGQDSGAGGQDSGARGQDSGAGGDSVTPEFRYLVVPLRVAARQ